MQAKFKTIVRQWQAQLLERSKSAVHWVQSSLRMIAAAWLIAFGLFALLKILLSPTPAQDFADHLQLIVPYLLVALSPLAGFLIGRAAITGKHSRKASSIRLTPFGKWQNLTPLEAIRHANYGPIGFLASLVIGMILNVIFRSGEYLLAIPALTMQAPEWGYTLFWLATLDTIVMNFFYMVCFVMALRTIPLFPKMLLYTWLIDIFLQLSIAKAMAQFGPPAEVADSLVAVLNGNIDKVLISAALWLPYLILSDRVNVTFRHRIAA